MTCKKLNRYFDGELSLENEKRFESHLKNCKKCQSEIAFLKSLEKSVICMPQETPPKEIFENITLQYSPKKDYHIFKNIAVSASFLLMIMMGTFFGNFYFDLQTSQDMLQRESVYAYLDKEI